MNKIILSMMAFAVSALCEAQPWMNIHDNEGNVYSLEVNNVEYIDFGEYVESGFTDYQTIAQQYFLLTKNEIPKLDTLAAEIGELTTSSSIQGGGIVACHERQQRAGGKRPVPLLCACEGGHNILVYSVWCHT